jgi:hypothetical protein
MLSVSTRSFFYSNAPYFTSLSLLSLDRPPNRIKKQTSGIQTMMNYFKTSVFGHLFGSNNNDLLSFYMVHP